MHRSRRKGPSGIDGPLLGGAPAGSLKGIAPKINGASERVKRARSDAVFYARVSDLNCGRLKHLTALARREASAHLFTRAETASIARFPVGIEQGLKHDSSIHCDELVSLPKCVLTDYVGCLSSEKLLELDRALAFALDLTTPLVN
jgi:hypothetical protein